MESSVFAPAVPEVSLVLEIFCTVHHTGVECADHLSVVETLIVFWAMVTDVWDNDEASDSLRLYIGDDLRIVRSVCLLVCCSLYHSFGRLCRRCFQDVSLGCLFSP